MACLAADLVELVGFFSYSREDDADSHGALSALRNRIQGELRGLLGRTARTFRLWQDKEAIPSGTLWETEIKNAVAQAVFFIPIITPTVVASPFCRFELESFVAREKALGRDDLIFPILYIDVPALQDDTQRQNDPVLSLIAARQYVDWRRLRHRDVHSTDVSEEVERFCTHIRDALRRRWVSPEERKLQEGAAAQRQAEAERRREEAETKRRAEEEARQRAAAQERQMREADAERTRIGALEAKARKQEAGRQWQPELEQQRAEAERRKADERRLRWEADAKGRSEEKEQRWLPLPKPRPALLIGCLVGLAALGAIGAWLMLSPMPAPVTPTSAPAAPTQLAAAAPLSAAQERALKPSEHFKECKECPEMVAIPAGKFLMGSPASEPGREGNEGPQQQIAFAHMFAAGVAAVTFDEWNACVAEGGCNAYRPGDYGWGEGKRPVINVSWDDAQAYVKWLSSKTGAPYRLLSEAEREYVTRGCASVDCPSTPFWFGAQISPDRANYDWRYSYNGSAKAQPLRRTVEADAYAPNPFGLLQVHGNVREWVQDCWTDTVSSIPRDGVARMTGDCTIHVVRGGSWKDEPKDLRSAKRSWEMAGERRAEIGFRVGRSLLN